MKITVIIKAFFLPKRSPMLPNITDPKGRNKKLSANIIKVDKIAVVSLAKGKNSFESIIA